MTKQGCSGDPVRSGAEVRMSRKSQPGTNRETVVKYLLVGEGLEAQGF